MARKLLTLKELSEYLGVSEKRITALVDEKVISAYRIGGELLRFRKEQIDAIRSEIESRVRKEDKVTRSEVKAKPKEKVRKLSHTSTDETSSDRMADFLYFYDFYIISGLLIILLLAVIFLG